MSVRVRFAPSPSGYLHIGGARTALFNWLWARQQGGQFIVRVEDTDQERSSIDSVRAVLDALEWLGLDWDEGPEKGGPHAPYFQSERRDDYRDAAERLIAEGKAYRCYCTKEELDAQRAALKVENPKAQFRYPGTCRERTDSPDRPHLVRFKVPREGTTDFDDQVFGTISTPNKESQDFVLVRPDGFPLYNLACVVDDHAMGITLVARGRDHIGNTPLQLMLYRALGWEPPAFAHLPMMLSSQGAKLSKRHADVGVQDYRARGYTPEGVLNYLVRFGWSSGDQEIFSRAELVEKFGWGSVGRSDGKFDEKKFADVAFEHLKEPALCSAARYAELVAPFLAARGLDGVDADRLLLAIDQVRLRARSLVDAADALDYFFRQPPEFDEKASRKFLTASAAPVLTGIVAALSAVSTWEVAPLEVAFTAYVESAGIKMKDAAQPVRVALTGRTASPGLFDVMVILGREASLGRLRSAVAVASGAAP